MADKEKNEKKQQSPLDEFGAQVERFASRTAESIKKVVDKALSARNTVLTIRVNDESNQVAVDGFKLCQSMSISKQIWWGANYYCHSLPQTNNWIVWDKRVEDKMKDSQSFRYL